jgi:hypothetical protein
MRGRQSASSRRASSRRSRSGAPGQRGRERVDDAVHRSPGGSRRTGHKGPGWALPDLAGGNDGRLDMPGFVWVSLNPRTMSKRAAEWWGQGARRLVHGRSWRWRIQAHWSQPSLANSDKSASSRADGGRKRVAGSVAIYYGAPPANLDDRLWNDVPLDPMVKAGSARCVRLIHRMIKATVPSGEHLLEIARP